MVLGFEIDVLSGGNCDRVSGCVIIGEYQSLRNARAGTQVRLKRELSIGCAPAIILEAAAE